MRQRSRQQLVEHDPDRVHIRARVHPARVAHDLLGAHIWHRTNELAHIGMKRDRLHVGIGEPRDAEVQNLGLADGRRGSRADSSRGSSLRMHRRLAVRFDDENVRRL